MTINKCALPVHACPTPRRATVMAHRRRACGRAQGQTLRRIGIYLPRPCFSHGQLYVAISRVGSWADLRFALTCDHDGQFRTPNVVWRDVLQNADIATQ